MATTWQYGGLCGCGCGQKTNVATRNQPNQGVRCGEPYEFVWQHHNNKKRRTYVVDANGWGMCGLPNPDVQINIDGAWQAVDDEDRAALDVDLQSISDMERRERELDYESARD